MSPRGPYMKYKIDPAIPIPRNTAYRMRKTESNTMPHKRRRSKSLDDINRNNDGTCTCNNNNQNQNITNHYWNDGEVNTNLTEENKDSDEIGIEYSVESDIEINELDDEFELNSKDDDVDELCSSIEDNHLNESVASHEIIADENDIKLEQQPLYPHCKITKQQADIFILTFAIRHDLTDIAIGDLLQLLNQILPVPVFPSKYLFLKKYDTYDASAKKYFCNICNKLLITKNNNSDEDTVYKEENLNESTRDSNMWCPRCNTQYSVQLLEKKKSFFIHIPLVKQMENFVNSDLYNYVTRINNERIGNDFIDSDYYKYLRKKKLISPSDLTLQLNTDGISPMPSSSYCLWPIQVMINELPYTVRRKNIFLCDIWFNKVKPPIDLFFSLTLKELTQLQNIGVQRTMPNGKVENIKFHLTICAVDSVARPMVQNIHQFNGEYGCTFCLVPGEIIATGSRVYKGTTTKPLRSREQYLSDARKATITRQTINGVKGPCILSSYTFDPTRSFTMDYMHTVLLGVTRTFVDAWFDSSNHVKEWYIGRKVDLVDNILLNIKPPLEISRTPRSLKERARWKASEWKNFLLYYSYPCISGVLPDLYVNHWSLFAYAIYIYLKPNFTHQEHHKAKLALISFVDRIELLYGEEFLKFNVHLLLHIPQCVLDFGALWTTSTFPFENYNGYICKMINSFKGIPQQICKKYYRFREIKKFYSETMGIENYNFMSQGIHFPLKMYSDHISATTSLNNQLRFSTISTKSVTLSLTQKTCIEEFLNMEVDKTADSHSWYVILKTGIKFHSSSNNSFSKRINSIAQLEDGTFALIKNIFTVYGVNRDRSTKVIEYHHLYENSNSNLRSEYLRYLYTDVVHNDDNISITFPQSLDKKCVLINQNTSNYNFVIPLVNNFERD